MRGPLTYDDVEELDVTARTPEQRRRAAATLVSWAEEPHPDDEEVSPASLLVAAGTHLAYAGDHEGAAQLFRRAVAAEGEAVPDARCYLHHELLELGEVDAARRLADEVRRSAPDDPDVYLFIAEDYELAGDLREALRWLNRGANRLDRLDPSGAVWSTAGADLLLRARRRVRRSLDYPPDELDELVPPPLLDA